MCDIFSAKLFNIGWLVVLIIAAANPGGKDALLASVAFHYNRYIHSSGTIPPIWEVWLIKYGSLEDVKSQKANGMFVQLYLIRKNKNFSRRT